jgi:hypothetical protein
MKKKIRIGFFAVSLFAFGSGGLAAEVKIATVESR